jgi:isoleucyl-tRNA synthetase
MPYSMACGTPLSNFEAGLNYKDVEDPALVVTFPITGMSAAAGGGSSSLEGYSLLAWTTTPWTLPSNLSLCVNETFEYVKVVDVKSGNRYILMEPRLVQLYPQMGSKKWKKADNATLFTIEPGPKLTGKDLVGCKYKPLFPFFEADYGERAFRVISDPYVLSDSGTGIVHQVGNQREREGFLFFKNTHKFV